MVQVAVDLQEQDSYSVMKDAVMSVLLMNSVSLAQSEDFFSLIESHEGKPLKLMVYNMETDSCREVFVTPNGAWGGEGRYGSLVSDGGTILHGACILSSRRLALVAWQCNEQSCTPTPDGQGFISFVNLLVQFRMWHWIRLFAQDPKPAGCTKEKTGNCWSSFSFRGLWRHAL